MNCGFKIDQNILSAALIYFFFGRNYLHYTHGRIVAIRNTKSRNNQMLRKYEKLQ
jgi:hypothetical protein